MAGTKTQKKPVVISDEQFTIIENQIKARTFKLSGFAVENGYDVAAVRSVLVARFGDQIEFKRGRTGGVIWR